jgi:hypothetical protein
MHDERTGRLNTSRKAWNAARADEMILKNQRVKIGSSSAALELYKTLRAYWVPKCRTE